MKVTSFALLQSAALGFLATANAQIFSNSSSAEPSVSPTAPAGGLEIADINIINSVTGGKESIDRYSPFVFSVDIDASETGSVWFVPPTEFGGFPESIEFDYGTVANDGSNNFTVEFTSVPDSGAATIEFTGSLTQAGIDAIPEPQTVTYESDSSSGTFSDSITFVALPNTVSKSVGLIDGNLYFAVDLPTGDYDGSLSLASGAEEGYSFDVAYTGVYFVASNPFNNGTLTAAAADNQSDESSILISFDGEIPDGAVSVRVVYKAIISGDAESYSNTAALTVPTLPASLAKRDVTIFLTSTIIVKGPLAGTVTSSISVTSDGSSVPIPSSSPSGSATGSATVTVTDLSTTVITTCPTCTGADKTTDVYVSTVTATVSGIVTEYTTYCPIETLTKTKVHAGKTETVCVDIYEVTKGVYTVKTEYIPINHVETTIVATYKPTEGGNVVYTTTEGGNVVVTTKKPEEGVVTTIKVSSQHGVSTYSGVAGNLQAGFASVLLGFAAFLL